jgi:hypothetical protein
MATPAGGHFFYSGRSEGDSKTRPCKGAALRIAHLPSLRDGAPEALARSAIFLAATLLRKSLYDFQVSLPSDPHSPALRSCLNVGTDPNSPTACQPLAGHPS